MSRLTGLYFLVQGVGIAVWWLALLAAPEVRVYFLPSGFPEHALMAFGLADVAAAIASFSGGVLIARKSSLAVGAVWFASGCVAYGALYCLSASILAGGPWLPTAVMVPAAFLSVVFACHATRS